MADGLQVGGNRCSGWTKQELCRCGSGGGGPPTAMDRCPSLETEGGRWIFMAHLHTLTFSKSFTVATFCGWNNPKPFGQGFHLVKASGFVSSAADLRDLTAFDS